ncbi:NADH-ubiquinone oxidoreductase [Clathrospora elynae]|uniref:NADH-ubiquinone oxidoreductase n=1 Tax=Clathrospora elynae TaxID=706981 RepID=A0A6A5SZE6_9PLEO|nr:NADH-ubiquinone oxidoreductase [Clathrospora elynae]
MFPTTLRALRSRSAASIARPLRTFASTATSANQVPANDPVKRDAPPNVSETNATPTSSEGSFDKVLQESTEKGEELRTQQAPNYKGTWSRSQNPRAVAMSGPRFEQSIMEDQPRPYAAIELIHKQPVRWTHDRTVSCDGGGGPLGHPRIFINLDKPQICWCTYCGLPFAHEKHRHHLESMPESELSYPLGPKGHAAEVSETQKVTDEPLAQR